MSEPRGSLAVLADHLAQAVGPLDRILRDPAAFSMAMARLGWDAPAPPASYAAIADAAADVVVAAEALADGPDLADVVAVIEAVGAIHQALDGLDEAPAGIDPGAFLPVVGRDLFEYLLADHLATELPGFFWPLKALGVVTFEAIEPAGERPGYVRTRFAWEELPGALADPAAVLAAAFGWGGAEFNFDRLMEIAGQLMAGIGITVSIDLVDPALGGAVQAQSTGAPAQPVTLGFTLSLFDSPGDAPMPVGLSVTELPAEGPSPPGVLVLPLLPPGFPAEHDVGRGWTFAVRSGTDLADQLGVVVRPGETAVRYPFAPDRALPDAGFGASLTCAFDPPRVLLGEPSGIRLELASLTFSLDLDATGDGLELTIGVRPDGLALVLAAGSLDAFLGSVLGSAETRVNVPFALSWSSRTGLGLASDVGFTVSLHPELAIGGVRVDRVDLALALTTGAAPELALRALAAISGTLGPISFTADGLGAELPFRFTAGNAGPFDVSFAFVLPTGLGLGVDVPGVVHGGGFVDLDFDLGRYSGALSLDILTIGIDAVVVVDTQLPGDPEGWALFASLSARFPGIPLGFGFTLLGVGGLLALNRTMDAEALAAGLRNGVIDTLLFPDDPVGDSAQLIAQIDDYFPLMDGNTVVGPVVMIGWGTPTIITAQLGIVVSLPDGVIAVMGSVSALLPVPDAPLLTINMDSLGVVDVAAGTFSLTASLYDSRLLATIDLGGDMAMYLSTSDQPYFLLSVGGYHPTFHPPSTVPASMHDLRRMSASIVIADVVTITVQTYFAVTSNSLQFGASVNLEASVEIWPTTYTARGWFEFDVLLIFSPFKIVADLAAGVGVYAGNKELMGVDLAAHLEGPEPWYASGRASFKFFGLKVEFELEVGGKAVGEPKPIAHPRADVLAALALPASWQEAGPVDELAASITYLTPDEDGGDTVWVRPDHQLTVRQSIAPLDRTLEIVGQAVPAAEEELLHITRAGIGNQPADPTTALDWFAPAQFEDLDRAEKLARASFEEMNAGVTFGHPETAITVNPDLTTSVDTGYEEAEWDSLADSVHSGAAGIALAQYAAPATPAFVITSTQYTVVHAVDGTEATLAIADAAVARGAGGSQYDALRARALRIAGDPGARTDLVVVPLSAVLAPVPGSAEPVPAP